MGEYLCIINSKKPERLPEGFTELAGRDYHVGIRGKYKFEKDCILEENQDILILLIGVVFNKLKLIAENKNGSWFQAIGDLYRKNGNTFFKDLKGSFNGIIYDKVRDRWLAYSNIQSERPVFYSIIDKEIIIASNISLIHEIHLKRHRKLSLSIDGAYMMLSYGFMLGNYTLYNEVKRIKAGFFLECENNSVREKEYYRFSNEEFSSVSENEVIENIDFLFLEAVKQQFEKDREYGYRHITSLSGGLDSRMTVCCAHELGYTDQLNITFSQSGYLEQTIACQIATKLKHEWIFKALDNGLFLYDLDRIIRITGGNIIYYAVAMEHSFFSHLNTNDFGLMHTGQLGDLYYDFQTHRKPHITDGAHSSKLLFKISQEAINPDDYENEEIFLVHNRYLNGTNNGLAGIVAFTETFSPFYELDFWELSLKIPLSLRFKHYIYKKWIIEKHPFAAEFIWEKTGVKIYDNLKDRLRLYHHGRVVSVNEMISGFYRRIARKYNWKYKPSQWAMNPFDSWIIINHDLKQFVDNYFDENILRIEDYPELKEDCFNLFSTGNGLEKIQVLTLLSAIKTYC